MAQRNRVQTKDLAPAPQLGVLGGIADTTVRHAPRDAGSSLASIAEGLGILGQGFSPVAAKIHRGFVEKQTTEGMQAFLDEQLKKPFSLAEAKGRIPPGMSPWWIKGFEILAGRTAGEQFFQETREALYQSDVWNNENASKEELAAVLEPVRRKYLDMAKGNGPSWFASFEQDRANAESSLTNQWFERSRQLRVVAASDDSYQMAGRVILEAEASGLEPAEAVNKSFSSFVQQFGNSPIPVRELNRQFMQRLAAEMNVAADEGDEERWRTLHQMAVSVDTGKDPLATTEYGLELLHGATRYKKQADYDVDRQEEKSRETARNDYSLEASRLLLEARKNGQPASAVLPQLQELQQIAQQKGVAVDILGSEQGLLQFDKTLEAGAYEDSEESRDELRRGILLGDVPSLADAMKQLTVLKEAGAVKEKDYFDILSLARAHFSDPVDNDNGVFDPVQTLMRDYVDNVGRSLRSRVASWEQSQRAADPFFEADPDLLDPSFETDMLWTFRDAVQKKLGEQGWRQIQDPAQRTAIYREALEETQKIAEQRVTGLRERLEAQRQDQAAAQQVAGPGGYVPSEPLLGPSKKVRRTPVPDIDQAATARLRAIDGRLSVLGKESMEASSILSNPKPRYYGRGNPTEIKAREDRERVGDEISFLTQERAVLRRIQEAGGTQSYVQGVVDSALPDDRMLAKLHRLDPTKVWASASLGRVRPNTIVALTDTQPWLLFFDTESDLDKAATDAVSGIGPLADLSSLGVDQKTLEKFYIEQKRRFQVRDGKAPATVETDQTVSSNGIAP